MEKSLEILINRLNRDEMSLFFGENYKVKITNIINSTNTDYLIIHLDLLIEESHALLLEKNEIYSKNVIIDDDITFYVKKSLNFMGFNINFGVVPTIKIV